MFHNHKVSELMKVNTFNEVHQLISTIEGTLENTNGINTIKEAFPMGSMTGMPKYKAMQLIEKYENAKRGLFSGTIGYIDPNNDFDFNVIIRSILYNETLLLVKAIIRLLIRAFSLLYKLHNIYLSHKSDQY